MIQYTGNTPPIPRPSEAPSLFAGYRVEIEYSEDLPAAPSQYLAAVRTPESGGLILAFVRRTGKGLLRVDAFDSSAEARIYPAADVEVIGRVTLTARVAAEGRAA